MTSSKIIVQVLNRDVKPNSRASARVFVKQGAAEEAAGGEAVCFLATFQPELSLCVRTCVCLREGGKWLLCSWDCSWDCSLL